MYSPKIHVQPDAVLAGCVANVQNKPGLIMLCLVHINCPN